MSTQTRTPGCSSDCEPFAHYNCPTAAATARTEADARWVALQGLVTYPLPDEIIARVPGAWGRFRDDGVEITFVELHVGDASYTGAALAGWLQQPQHVRDAWHAVQAEMHRIEREEA